MKKSNLLTMDMATKIEPILKFNWLPTNLSTLCTAAIILATAITSYQMVQAKKPSENNSLAWYVANPKEALATNKICFDNPQMRGSEACVNSLHALEMTHKGPNS